MGMNACMDEHMVMALFRCNIEWKIGDENFGNEVYVLHIVTLLLVELLSISL